MSNKQQNNPQGLKGEHKKGAVEGKKQSENVSADKVNARDKEEQDASLTTPENIKLGTYEAYEPGIGTYSLTEHDLEYGFGQRSISDDDKGAEPRGKKNNGK